jgi:hypothetical protein
MLLLITASCSTRQKSTDMRLALSMRSMVGSVQKSEKSRTQSEQRLQDISQCCGCGFGFGADLEFKDDYKTFLVKCARCLKKQ